jgi:DNA-binding transcriptional ArsR family regulator
MQETLHAISAPRRREILRLVWDRELSAGQIASRFEDVTWAAVSQHLRVLREAGLIRERRDGNHRLYKADRRAFGPLRAVLTSMWEQDLDRLQVAAEREQRLAKGKGRRK